MVEKCHSDPQKKMLESRLHAGATAERVKQYKWLSRAFVMEILNILCKGQILGLSRNGIHPKGVLRIVLSQEWPPSENSSLKKSL